MEFQLAKASGGNVRTIEITDLEELLQLVRDQGHPIIINEPWQAGSKVGSTWWLQVYDDYLE